MYMKTSQETAQKIKILKTKKQYKELLDLAAILNKAREWAAMSAVSEAEVKAAEDFSDAPEAQGG